MTKENTINTPKKWEFDFPYSAYFCNGLGGKDLMLFAHNNEVASFSVEVWGGEQECIEAAWRYAYEGVESDALRVALINYLSIIDGLIEESGRSIDYGEEDPFRMG